MQSVQAYRGRIRQANRNEYGAGYNRLKWLTDNEANKATKVRNDIIAFLEPHARFLFKQTKPARGALSPGCEICGEGTWSCLFINGRCNCRCFYCPTAQDHIDIPTTNAVQFPRPQDYTDYIEVFKFRGVGLSGGEPLLTFDRTLDYLSVLKKRFGDRVYVWLYTNGTLVNEDRLLRLRDAGLDEIRFDSSASGYDMRMVTVAAKSIAAVTVEIPAIPEDFELLQSKIIQMQNSGVQYLNLHQLRLTPHNFANLSSRPYTFLHGEKVTVLESEITALRLLEYMIINKIDLPINYCSFPYKHRFQRATARIRNAYFVRQGYEDITENGYLRYLCLMGDKQSLTDQAGIFRKYGCPPEQWQLTDAGDRLYFNASLWNHVDFKELKLLLGYCASSFRSSPTYHKFFREVRLNRNKTVAIEKEAMGPEIMLVGDEITSFKKWVIGADGAPNKDLAGEKWENIAHFEFIPSGLQEYF